VNQNPNYYQHETERLFLRRLQKSDIADWAIFFDNNPNLPYLGIISSNDTKDYTNLDWSKKQIDIQLDRYQQTGYGLLAVISKETGELIGQTGILQKELKGNIEYEIAYSLIPDEWGKGYASEMSSILVDYAIEHQINSRIISIIHIDNIASQNVARKNGMEVLFNTIYAEMNVFVYGRNI
jgi:ribosomal-protein-alanine N-acetyltransferase